VGSVHVLDPDRGAGPDPLPDILEGITVHEEVDEVTGLSRYIIVDSPDEKKQPAVEIKGKDGKVNRKYHMPVHAHMMVQDGEMVSAGDVLAKIPRETTRPRTSRAVCRESSSSSRAQAARDRRHLRDRRSRQARRDREGSAEDHHRARRAGREPREYSAAARRARQRAEGERVRAGEPVDGRSVQPARYP